MAKKILLFFCLVGSILLNAQRVTRLPRFFSDSMILQRNTIVSIWGTDSATIPVIVVGSWGKSDTAITNSDGKWRVALETPNTTGPYSITIQGSTSRTIHQVLMGEVWLCSGQSNMEMPMKGYTNNAPFQLIDSADYFIANSLNNNIRFFRPGWNPVSAVPLTDYTTGSWISAGPNSTPDFSAMAYFFARKIQAKLGVPVGILVCTRGGSKIEAWMDSLTLSSVRPVVTPPVLTWQEAHNTDLQMYKATLHPIIGYTIKGFLWSQGESNLGTSTYQELFTKMIASWRQQWGLGNIPFYFTQIAPYGTTNDFSAARLREAQLHTMLTTTNTGMVGTLDIGDQHVVHYPKKKVVGDRLADWALIRTYGFAGIPSGPIFKSLTIRADTINLRFDYTANGLTSLGLGLSDFEIAGANKVFYPATVTAANFGYSLNVRSSSVTAPLYVRYGFKNWVEGSLFNSTALPAPSFRTEQMQALYTSLPVVFGSFMVNTKNNSNWLSFTTLLEDNLDYFELEKSTDGLAFSKQVTIQPKGNNSNYGYEDKQLATAQTHFYRIKAVHKDAATTYSKIISIKLDLSQNIAVVNPSTQLVNIHFKHPFSGTICVIDNMGRVIRVQKVENKVGTYIMPVLQNANGVYRLHFISNNGEQLNKTVSIL